MFILSADPSLGRVDYSSLSDQTLMEMLFDGFDDEAKKKYQDNEGMYLDVCDWSCVTCDDDERVIKIGADSSEISGSIQFCYVPPKVKKLKVIPSWLGSELTGSVDLAHLPKDMKHLDLQNNMLTGKIDLTKLPEGMKKLFLDHNQLTGEIDLTQLPKGMRSLRLDSNQLTGEIDLTCLPEGMQYLHISRNQLCGSLVMNQLPQEMRIIAARLNHFNAVAVVSSETLATIKLRGSGVTSVVDEIGRELDKNQFL